jgi:AcrR family transcriptional regulator
VPEKRRTRLTQAERKGQILDAARRVFSREPAGTVTMEAVAREAGVTAGLVYHYFGGRHELYVAVVREMFRAAPPVPDYVAGATPEQRLAKSIGGWLDMVAENRETWLAALGAEGLGEDPEIEAIFERVREAAADNIIAVLGIGPAESAPTELRALLRAYGGLAEAATREWLQHGRLDRRQTHALLTASLLRLVEDVLPLLEPAAVLRLPQ